MSASVVFNMRVKLSMDIRRCLTSISSAPAALPAGPRQARYLAKRIQRFNADFQAPVILCGSLNAPAGPSLNWLRPSATQTEACSHGIRLPHITPPRCLSRTYAS